MVTVGMNYKVLPGKEELFEKAFDRVRDAMRQSKGHTDSHLFKEVGTAGTYLIISEWSDKDSYDEFLRSESFARVVNWGREEILAGRPRHQVYLNQ